MRPEHPYCEDPSHDKRLCIPRLATDVHPGGMGAAFFEAMRTYSDRIAQIDAISGRTQTYGQLLSESVRIAGSLEAAGLQPEDIVCFCSRNSIECFAAIIATYFAGGISSALDPSFCLSESIQFLKLLEPKFIFCDEEGLVLIEAALRDCKISTNIICFCETDKYMKFSDMLAAQVDEEKFEPKRPKSVHDTCSIFFSSGSTGINKGICTTHFSALRAAQERRGTYLYYAVTRFCWISSALTYTAAIMTGSSWIASGDFDVKHILRTIEKYRVSCLIISLLHGYQITKKAQYIGDTSSLIGCFLTGARVSEDLVLDLRKLLPNTVVLQGYGLTEGSSLVLTFTEDDLEAIQAKPGSVGHPIAGTCAKVLDIETGKEVDGPYKSGELRIKLDRIFKCYYKNPKVTESAFDSDGYFCTGDIVYYDEDYHFYFVDRLKEMMKFRSFYVYPLELESILMKHPQIVEAVVVPIPHEEDMEHPMGVVKLVKDATVTAEEIREFVDSKVVDYKRLRGGIKIVDEIPQTGSFKLRRKEVKDFILNEKKIVGGEEKVENP